jgi:hypothetical protein
MDAVAGGSLRLGWVAGVVAAGIGLGRGLLLTTYFELTPRAQADSEAGRWWLWGATVALLALVGLALRWWQPAPFSLVALGVAGPVALLVEGQGWIPLIALLAVVPLLLAGCAGVLSSPRRPVDA